MGWEDADPLVVIDTGTAAIWWGRLLKFLNLQESTTRLRRWPSIREWAHGDAAVAQRRAEICAKALGPAVESGSEIG